jgi:hypothetical protein
MTTLLRALLLSIVAAGALVLPMAEQLGFDQVWEQSEVEDGEEVDDDAHGPLFIERQVLAASTLMAAVSDLEPAGLERDGVRLSFERPPRG